MATTKKTTKKKTQSKKSAPSKAAAPKAEKQTKEELCVFAFRLTEQERLAIHEAAGPRMAAKFARQLLAAAAKKDLAAVKAIMEGKLG
jgi:hypothetical protein